MLELIKNNKNYINDNLNKIVNKKDYSFFNNNHILINYIILYYINFDEKDLLKFIESRMIWKNEEFKKYNLNLYINDLTKILIELNIYSLKFYSYLLLEKPLNNILLLKPAFKLLNLINFYKNNRDNNE